jgi:SAM-dependent methyltransferase
MDYPFIYLKNIKRGKLLELGVGSGETLRKFIDWGWDAEGLDFDPKAVRACSEVGLTVGEGDLASQNYESGTFDAIFSSHVLEHVPDPLALMKEGVRVLKQGGLFVAVTPNGNSALHSLFKSNWRGLEPPRHLNTFTFNALVGAAKEAGFSRIDVVTSNFSAAGVFYYSAYLSGIKKTFLLRLISNLARFTLTLIQLFFKKSGEELILVAYK